MSYDDMSKGDYDRKYRYDNDYSRYKSSDYNYPYVSAGPQEDYYEEEGEHISEMNNTELVGILKPPKIIDEIEDQRNDIEHSSQLDLPSKNERIQERTMVDIRSEHRDNDSEETSTSDESEEEEKKKYKYRPKNPKSKKYFLNKKGQIKNNQDDTSSDEDDDEDDDDDDDDIRRKRRRRRRKVDDDIISGGLCGNRRIGVLGVWEINVRWNTLPVCLINPRFCSDMWSSENRFLLLLTNIEFFLHMMIYFLNGITWILYWVVMWWVLGEDRNGWMEKLGRIVLSPIILFVGTLVLIPFEFIFKYWAIYSAGIGKNPIIGYTIYTLSSIILLIVHTYCLVGFSGTLGIYSMIETFVEGNRGHPDRAREGYFNFVVAVSAFMCLFWILSIIYSLGIMTLLLCKCRKNVVREEDVSDSIDDICC